MNRWRTGFLALLLTTGTLGLTLAGDVESHEGKWELGPFVGFGMPDDYDVTGGLTLEPDDGGLYGFRVGYWATPKFSFEGSFQNLSTETDTTAVPSSADLELSSYRVNWLYNFRDGQRWRPFATIGVGSHRTDVETGFDQDGVGVNAGGGIRMAVSDSFGLRFDGRAVSIDTDGPLSGRNLDVEATIGASWFLGGPKGDADGDGVKDGRDQCPGTPRGAIVDARGCKLDGDGDGVADGIDKCPETPKGHPVDAKGCTKDSDGDGVHDGIDKCPDTPRGETVDASGCAKDSDGDGVPDSKDKCPDTPRGTKVDAKGCKIDGDDDGDGVPNSKDKCPGTPKGTKVDSKGCRELFTEERDTLVLRGVQFEYNSAELTSESEAILDRVAKALVQWPDVRVEVSGHTDSKGSDAYNLDLSARRAQSVKNFLVKNGVAAGRLEARGFGEARPVGDNKTDAGRALNRRVELKKLN